MESIVKMFLTFSKGPKPKAAKQHKEAEAAHKASTTTGKTQTTNKPHLQQPVVQIAAQRAPNSSNTTAQTTEQAVILEGQKRQSGDPKAATKTGQTTEKTKKKCQQTRRTIDEHSNHINQRFTSTFDTKEEKCVLLFCSNERAT